MSAAVLLTSSLGFSTGEVCSWSMDASGSLKESSGQQTSRVVGSISRAQGKSSQLPIDTETILEHWQVPANYLSYEEHRARAEEILHKERQAGWMDWRPSLEELEQAHGSVTLNRSGVVARTKLKLILQDWRRSSVNQKIDFNERLVLPRLAGL